VHEYVGAQLNKLRIAFVPPEEFFHDALQALPGAVAICGRPGLLERPIDLGYMVHLCLPREWGSELYSGFWLGHIRSWDGARIPEAIGNLPWVRRLQVHTSLGRFLALHCHEEMNTLAGFLADLYESEAEVG